VGVVFRWSVHIFKYGKNGKIAEKIGMVLTVDVVVYSGQGAFPNMESVAMQNER
jgi:hypothetical protein